MTTRLSKIRDWSALLERANWSVTGLATLCGVSARTLERHFLKHQGQTPKSWLDEQRRKLALKLRCDGFSGKEIAARLGYNYATNLTRKLKTDWVIPVSKANEQVVRADVAAK